LYAMGGMIEILGGSFIANTAITTDDDQDAGLGGAILFGDGIVASVRATMFDFNSATGPGVFGNGIGGALFIGGSDDTSDPVRLPSHVTVDECDFQGNAAAIAAGAIWLQGRNAGALPPSTLDLRDSFFESNNAGNGGAMTIFGSGVASVEDCIFTANYVPLVDSPIGGGAVSAGFFNVSTFTNCLFMDNTSAGVGGAVSGVAGSTHMLFNCEFRNNEAAGPGGALYNSSYFDIPSTMSAVNCLLACNTADEGAGAYNEAGCNLSMVNCTLGHNVADTGGGGLANVGEGAVAEFLNGILWENDAPIDPQILEGPGIVTVFFSIVEGGWPGTGNLSTPPAWIDADADDCPDGNYRLSELSPAIDAGDPRLVTTVFDLDGLDRVVGNSVDLGAYEFQSIPCPTDLTGNGVTDVEDLVIVISGWGTPAGDVNGDGMTDVVDLTLVITAWGACE
ncbi:MAG: choice-of-anchor Q domain-containing protein, partial [Planctomycetota bacterium]